MTTKLHPVQTPIIDRSTVSSHYSGAVAAGSDILDASVLPSPITITVVPGGACTGLVEYSTTPGAAQSPSAAIWQAWPAGAVSAATTDVFLGRLMAIRISMPSGSYAVAYEVVA